ncbi:MAG: hypothetical protein PHS02_00450 [Candidatus ainarchaeum sp.]|nr:hypothetical protein [Candidatus ainarchaeum sp.]
MEIRISEKAERDLDAMDRYERKSFMKHIEKISALPPRRHLKFGLPFNVEQVNQGRIIYNIESGTMYVLRCFPTHKEYEKWYQSFR